MAERPIPRPDGDFDAYVNHYVSAVNDFWTNYGLDPAELDALGDGLTGWFKAYGPHITAQAAAMAARQRKDAARRELERAIRPVTAFIQGFNKTTDADRATIGITIRETGGAPTRTPTSRPL